VQFYAGQAAKRSGLPLYVVDRYDRNGIFHPSIRRAAGSGRHRPRLSSLEDVIALSVASRLRRLGLPARRISRVLAAVRANAMVQPRYLLTDGKSVFFRDDGGSVLDLLRQHQAAFALFLEPLYPKR
jgi:DNA-binding transcriptional MerR regulator